MKRINPMLKWLPFMLPLSFIVAFAVIKVPTNLNFTLPDQAFIQSFQTSFISIILKRFRLYWSGLFFLPCSKCLSLMRRSSDGCLAIL